MMKCLFYRHNQGTIKDALPPARLSNFGLALLFKGKLQYEVEGETIELLPGDAIFLPKGCLRARARFSDSDHVSFHFEAAEAPDLPVYLPGVVSAPIRRLAAAFDELAEGCEGPEDERFSTFLDFLIAALRAELKKEREDPVVTGVKRFLGENLDRKVTLSDVARAVSFSPGHCQAVFREATGRSIIDTLLDMRIKKAKELIASGEFSLYGVAERVGFGDYNYFSRQFRARAGVSPSGYRRTVI